MEFNQILESSLLQLGVPITSIFVPFPAMLATCIIRRISPLLFIPVPSPLRLRGQCQHDIKIEVTQCAENVRTGYTQINFNNSVFA